MCHFLGTLDRSLINPLVSAGLHRGNTAFSYTRIGLDTENNIIPKTLYLEKTHAPITEDRLIRMSKTLDPFVGYHIVHTQAPTGNFKDLTKGDVTYGVHPAIIDDMYLWHNGLLRNVRDRWDTEVILSDIKRMGWSALDYLEGSFSCIAMDRESIFIFRNSAAPLYVELNTPPKIFNMTVSTQKFENSFLIPSGAVYRLNFNFGTFDFISKFKLNEDPFYFADEINE